VYGPKLKSASWTVKDYSNRVNRLWLVRWRGRTVVSRNRGGLDAAIVIPDSHAGRARKVE
jgi:hypothetical protein